MDLLEDVQVWCVRGCEGVSESECVLCNTHNTYVFPTNSIMLSVDINTVISSKYCTYEYM